MRAVVLCSLWEVVSDGGLGREGENRDVLGCYPGL